MDQTRARRALDLLPREAPPHVVELHGGADLARASGPARLPVAVC